jgi:hypothetical protein
MWPGSVIGQFWKDQSSDGMIRVMDGISDIKALGKWSDEQKFLLYQKHSEKLLEVLQPFHSLCAELVSQHDWNGLLWVLESSHDAVLLVGIQSGLRDMLLKGIAERQGKLQ